MPGETIPELLRATSEKNYLLRHDLADYLDELYKKAVYGYTLHLQFMDLPVGEQRTRLVKEHADIVLWLTEAPAELRQRFMPYLKFAGVDEQP